MFGSAWRQAYSVADASWPRLVHRQATKSPVPVRTSMRRGRLPALLSHLLRPERDEQNAALSNPLRDAVSWREVGYEAPTNPLVAKRPPAPQGFSTARRRHNLDARARRAPAVSLRGETVKQ